MRNKKAAELRQQYEAEVKAACERCDQTIENARSVFLDAKRQARQEREKAIKAIRQKIYKDYEEVKENE